MEKLQNQQVKPTEENWVVTLAPEILGAFCTKCMQPYNPSCEICNWTWSKVVELFTEEVPMEQVTALHCKYGCNSMRSCKWRCSKWN